MEIPEEAQEILCELVLQIRQYLCDTEFAPPPFDDTPIDPQVLRIEFPDKIYKAIAPLIEKQAREKLIEEIEEILIEATTRCSYESAVAITACLEKVQALKENKGGERWQMK